MIKELASSLFQNEKEDSDLLQSIEEWIAGLDSISNFKVEKIPFSQMRSWAFDKK